MIGLHHFSYVKSKIVSNEKFNYSGWCEDTTSKFFKKSKAIVLIYLVGSRNAEQRTGRSKGQAVHLSNGSYCRVKKDLPAMQMAAGKNYVIVDNKLMLLDHCLSLGSKHHAS